MSPAIDLSGRRFGRLLVLNRMPQERRVRFKCICDCGNIKAVDASNLKRLHGTMSCGCWRDSKRISPDEKERRLREARRRWVENNPGKVRAIKRRFYLLHQSEMVARSAIYRSLNPEVIKAHTKLYWRVNKVKIMLREMRPEVRRRRREVARALITTNPDKAYASKRNRRAREKGALGCFTAADVAEIRIAQRGKCAMPWCKKKLSGKGEVDHITSLARGGTNYRRNLQLLCRLCNLRKGSKPPLVFAMENGLLL